MNLKAFPFYSSLQQQSRYTVPNAVDAAPLYAPNNRLLPFTIVKPTDGKLIDCFNIYHSTGQLAHSIPGNQVAYESFSAPDGNDYVFYYGATLPVTLNCGSYYAEVLGWYSEVFSVVPDLSQLLKIEWRNDTNIAGVLYQTGFIQRCYLNTELSEPETKTEDEGAEDGYGNFVPTLVKLQRFLKFEAGLLAPFLADALQALPLHNNVTVGSYTKVKEITAKPDYPVDGYGMLAVISIEFAESEPIISKVCQEPLVLTSHNVAGYSPALWRCDPTDPTPDWQPTGNFECIQG